MPLDTSAVELLLNPDMDVSSVAVIPDVRLSISFLCESELPTPSVVVSLPSLSPKNKAPTVEKPQQESRTCVVINCRNKIKRNHVCWRHGGFRNCTVVGCSNRVKARGLCWSHGGGKRCISPGCMTTALRYGLCWAHGGGKRCVFEGCNRPAYERNKNRCDLHCSAPRTARTMTVAI
ncbi:hypothetical protein LEN26_009720 [Aphanomyces euteiches]|nr:hypothetical protein AeMF1_012476 [Aphanomyces euteiches]KAH9124376.1 hypothetical protein LEN26_009720 [Aphanomyces euteiches]KAH9192085.1 hypothetical protein AeNC1_005940 [Aphanomyces euteiches]